MVERDGQKHYIILQIGFWGPSRFTVNPKDNLKNRHYILLLKVGVLLLKVGIPTLKKR